MDSLSKDVAVTSANALLLNQLGACGLASMACTSLGFAEPFWAITIGYGLSIASQAVVSLWMRRKTLDALAIVHLSTMIFYGVRLSTFLLWREKLSSYLGKKKDPVTKKQWSWKEKLVLWLACSSLYTGMYLPAFFNSLGRKPAYPQITVPISYAGASVAVFGAVTEAVADHQKQVSKEKNPEKPVMSGLFKYSRCFNYFAELACWWGSYLAGARAYKSLTELLVSAIGVLGISSIMISGAKRRDADQLSKYKGNPEFDEYVKRTPVLLPVFGRRRIEEKAEEKKEAD